MVEFLQISSIPFYLIFIAIWGIMNPFSVITILIAFELALLGCSYSFILYSIYLDDIVGQVIATMILSVAGAESALGLAIVLAYCRLKGHILIKSACLLKA